MTNTSIQRQVSEIKSFFRFEIPYSRLKEPAVFLQDHPGICSITFEDVLAALKNMRERNAGIDEIMETWFAPLMEIFDMTGLPEAVGMDSLMKETPSLLPENPFERGKVLIDVMGMFIDAADELDDYEFHDMLDDFIEVMENTLYNEERPVSEWKLSVMQEMRFAQEIFEKEQIELADPVYKELFVKCLDDCCEKGIYDALRIKAFILCGGNSVYPCDWQQAKEYLEILTEEIEDPMAANALGYIHLRGRTNNGMPDYEQAYRYFSFAAFAGVYEAMYNTADLLAEGKGILRSEGAAMNQVRFVYSHTKTPFTEGVYSIAFADAAYRMGNYHRDGVGTDEDLLLAYSYYLDAQTALFYRMRYDKTWGDDELFEQVQDALTEMERRLGSLVHEERSSIHEPALIDRILSGGFPVMMEYRQTDEGADLIFRRTDKGPKDLMLLTVESMSYSALKKTIKIKLTGIEESTLDDGDMILIDRVGYDMFTGETFFWFGTDEQGRVKADLFVYEDDRPKNWQSHEFRTYASVIFREENKAEEMLCELPGIKKGTRVLAERKGKMTEGIIGSLFKARDYELGRKKIGRVVQPISARLLS